MHLQPRPKSANGATSSSSTGFKGLYSPYGFLPEKIQTENKQAFVQLFDQKNTSPQLRTLSGPGSSRALVSYSNTNNGINNSAAVSMNKIEILESELETTREQLTSERIVVGELEGQVDSLTLQVVELKEQLKSKSWAMVEKDRHLKRAEYKNEMMVEEGQALLEEMKLENVGLQNEIKELREVIASWERRWNQIETSMDESEEQLRHAEKRNESLELKVSESKLELKKSQNAVEEKDIKISTLNKLNSDLESQVKANRHKEEPDNKDQMISLMEQVNSELALLRVAREEVSNQRSSLAESGVNQQLPSMREEETTEDASIQEESQATITRGNKGNSSSVSDIGEAIGQSIARRLPKEIVEQLKQPLIDAVFEAVRGGATHRSAAADNKSTSSNSNNNRKKDKNARNSSPHLKLSRENSASSTIGTNEAIYSDSITLISGRGSFRGQLPSLSSEEPSENIAGDEISISKREKLMMHRSSSENSNLGFDDVAVDEEEGDGTNDDGDGASTYMSSHANQVPDEDTQVSMRAVMSRKGSRKEEADDDEEAGDGFTLADALTLNDGLTLGDYQTVDEGNHPLSEENQDEDQDQDTNGASSSFDRRTFTGGSLGSPTFTHQPWSHSSTMMATGGDQSSVEVDMEGGVDIDDSGYDDFTERREGGRGGAMTVVNMGSGGVGRRPSGGVIKFSASPSVESGLSVNSGTLPQNDEEGDEGESRASTSSY